jgi:hypothetical protein
VSRSAITYKPQATFLLERTSARLLRLDASGVNDPGPFVEVVADDRCKLCKLVAVASCTLSYRQYCKQLSHLALLLCRQFEFTHTLSVCGLVEAEGMPNTVI